MLDIRSDSEVDERIVSRLDDYLVQELRVRWENELTIRSESFESFCVRYILDTIHDMDHMNF